MSPPGDHSSATDERTKFPCNAEWIPGPSSKCNAPVAAACSENYPFPEPRPKAAQTDCEFLRRPFFLPAVLGHPSTSIFCNRLQSCNMRLIRSYSSLLISRSSKSAFALPKQEHRPFTAVISRGRAQARPQNYRSFEAVFEFLEIASELSEASGLFSNAETSMIATIVRRCCYEFARPQSLWWSLREGRCGASRVMVKDHCRRRDPDSDSDRRVGNPRHGFQARNEQRLCESSPTDLT